MSRHDDTTQACHASIVEFLANVWSENGVRNSYAFIGWKDNRGWKEHAFHIGRCRDNRVRGLITKHADCDLYFCSNVFSSDRRLRSCALPSTWGWCDIDHDDLSRFPIAPSIVWETSPKRYQALWLWDKSHSLHEAETYSRALAYDSGSDKSGWDYGQMLRIPGTISYKRARPHLVRLVKCDGTRIKERPKVTNRERKSDTAGGDIDWGAVSALDGHRLKRRDGDVEQLSLTVEHRAAPPLGTGTALPGAACRFRS